MSGFDLSTSNLQSNFNSAALVLLRLDDIKKHMHEFRINGNYEGWIETLISFYTEIASQIPKDDSEKITKTLLSARSDVRNMQSYNEDDLFTVLLGIELQLEAIFDSKGNKFRYAEDGSRALGRI